MSVINCLSVRIWLYQTPSLSRQCTLCLSRSRCNLLVRLRGCAGAFELQCWLLTERKGRQILWPH